MLVAEAELLKLSSYDVWGAIETIIGSSGVVNTSVSGLTFLINLPSKMAIFTQV